MNVTWSVHDDRGELVAHGIHHFDAGGSGYIAPVEPIDPYEPALAVAQSIETALINYLPDDRCRIVAHDAANARSIAVHAL